MSLDRRPMVRPDSLAAARPGDIEQVVRNRGRERISGRVRRLSGGCSCREGETDVRHHGIRYAS
jgi:hypothetical protein